jgi:hypothetical protein
MNISDITKKDELYFTEMNVSTSTVSFSSFQLSNSFQSNLFVVFIIFFYAAFLTLVLWMNTKPNNDITTDSSTRVNEYLMKDIQHQVYIKQNKILLEELNNKEFRERAWAIYRTNTNQKTDEASSNSQQSSENGNSIGVKNGWLTNCDDFINMQSKCSYISNSKDSLIIFRF